MREKALDLDERPRDLLDELINSDSSLARRCQGEPRFCDWLVQVVHALREFYGRLNEGALRRFDAKVHQWITNPPDSYTGFVGEMRVADWLRQKGVSHQFMPETVRPPRTPGLMAMVGNRRIYLEIRTMSENRYMRFAERVAQRIASASPGCWIAPTEVVVEEENEEALLAIAVEIIESALSDGLYNPIEYEGEEGKFSLVFQPGTACGSQPLSMVFYWPEVRDYPKQGEGYVYMPWLDRALVGILTEKREQFQTREPTFLVWVSDDQLLSAFKPAVTRVLERHGHEFDHVAGVIIFHPRFVWDLTENPSYRQYEELERADLFRAVDALRGGSTRL